jgi:hypothetical protein
MKKIIFALAIASLSGCASAPKTITPVPFDSTHSFAYNIAAQTDLLMDHSPLRDFTKEEVAESKAKLKEYSSPSKVFGVAYMLMGNLTGIIDVAGGGITDMALAKHTASKSRWIIFIPKSQFKSNKEAKDYIITSIDLAAEKALSKIGPVSKVLSTDGDMTYTALKVGGKNVTVGLVEPINHESITLTETMAIDEVTHSQVEAYSYGTTNGVHLSKNIIATTPTISIANVELNKTFMTGDELNTNITKYLPKGFYLYSPSLPRSIGDNKTYTDLSIQTPAIYTQGHKYEFVKP